jgi:hypothetical protein
MGLSTAQLLVLKNDILADPVLAAKPLTSGGAYEIVEAYKLLTNTLVWQTAVPNRLVFDAIDFSKYTPTDTPTTGDSSAVSATYLNRSQAILIKQANLLAFLRNDSIDFSKANIRAGLRDSVIGLPSGVSGASASAGGASGVTVLTAGTRLANRIEKLLSLGSQTTGTVTADVMGWEGPVSTDDVQIARES